MKPLLKIDEFTKARLKITFFITLVSSLIISIFSGTIYYFYKQEIIYSINDELKSVAFSGIKLIESSQEIDVSSLDKLKIPEDGYVCIYDFGNSMLYYKGKVCNITNHFSGFRLIGQDVIYGLSFPHDIFLYHIYVGKSLKSIVQYLKGLKKTLIYSTFGISVFIMFLSFFISKRILMPIQKTLEKQERFSENVSHDLRTPLSIISSQLFLIKQKNYQNIEKNIEVIDNTAKHMKNLISNILFLAQIGDKKEKTKVNINEIIKKYLELFDSEIKQKNIKVFLHENSTIEVEANEKDMEILISNLLENAIKHNKENGKIIIELNNKTLYIKNTGHLIKEENLDKIFDRFFKEDRSRNSKSSGLGLSIVKEIIDHYKFKIKVKTVDDMNEFTIKF